MKAWEDAGALTCSAVLRRLCAAESNRSLTISLPSSFSSALSNSLPLSNNAFASISKIRPAKKATPKKPIMIRPKVKYTSALALIAFTLGGIGISYGKPTPVINNWTLIGPSPGGGFVIQGNSPLNLGELSPTTSPVHLSTNGSDIITLDAGSTASTTLTPVIDFEAPGNTLNNYGSIIGEFGARWWGEKAQIIGFRLFGLRVIMRMRCSGG